MIKRHIVVISLMAFATTVFGQAALNITDSPLDLYTCSIGGATEAMKCQQTATGQCKTNDNACNCKSVNKWFDQCFNVNKMQSTGQCAPVLSKVEDYRKHAIEQCTIYGLEMDGNKQPQNQKPKGNGASALSHSSALAVASISLTSLLSFIL
ncbi:hypothetical protein MIR68_005950 [Amoeboaphelidium protococcarum]|nr:hypothetical protein MIR68_005950 [Amoeboaphelidium protococcarum]